jgi:hypothetical protein
MGVGGALYPPKLIVRFIRERRKVLSYIVTYVYSVGMLDKKVDAPPPS